MIEKTKVEYSSFFKIFLTFILLMSSVTGFTQDAKRPLIIGRDGKLQYQPDEKGDRIPDFSYAGYKASEEEIPLVNAKVLVPNINADATADIQKAIDYIATLPPDQDGFKGAVLLDTGTFHVNGRLVIKSSGIVIRGSGTGRNGTTLIAGGKERQNLIRVLGPNNVVYSKPVNITSQYVPVNAFELQLESTKGLSIGDQIFIRRPSTKTWIQELNMREFGGEETGWIGWKEGTRDIIWDRTITAINGNTILVDAPLTTALDQHWGISTVTKYNWPGRIKNIGIEHMNLKSDFDASNPKDEDHCWSAITIENSQDVWVRQVKFTHFAGSAVAVYETARRVTVQDCVSKEPVSEIGGQRRYTFFTMGQQTLFQRLYSEYGYHDFAVGFCAAGPNAFVQCEAHLPYEFSGTIDSWASGVLFDIVNVDGNMISFSNQGLDNQGSGWTAANSMLWQCSAARINNYAPPTAMNWAYGAWSQFSGNGIWVDQNNHVKPRSLFYAQLAERLKKDAAAYEKEVMPYSSNSTSSPTADEAKTYSEQSFQPALRLEDWIREAPSRDPVLVDNSGIKTVEKIKEASGALAEEKHLMSVQNGKLVVDGKLVTGMRFTVPWWRGVARPYATAKATPAVTRYVPGRNGYGYTDNLNEVVDWMNKYNMVGLEQNYGLWYDRRRDDHERVRRMDGQVWAPFYEQPFARSGKGTAWDGLSKYDLTKYDYFYWNRLKQFADLADQNGKLLVHHNYFQHNILEAGAHWVDCPWRPVNNINDTGFPEPVPFAGDKRIYMAEQFYDETDPVRRPLHQAFIKQCMNNFDGNSNVLQLTSAEYTGPYHFTAFWLETIHDWENETGKDQLIGLSATKDVQDSVLENQDLAKLVDVIDIRYWAYREDGSLYAPLGDQQLAPRQHARKINVGKRSFNSVYHSVYTYTSKYPDKAVIFSEGRYNVYGWAVLMAGGSLTVLPEGVPDQFLADAARMHPEDPGSTPDRTCILEGDDGMIVYCNDKRRLSVDLSNKKGKFQVQFIRPSDGSVLAESLIIKAGEVTTIDLPHNGTNIVWIRKK
ncbi:DUF6298 domain-containing protein [Saccharicrinis sp. FJH54]|uniref:DUF6298 domain-containing protein n=1 Tax=Saccharicrinis sp. FJH54 TaxID=3344665 RepID=UPI0035D49C73